MDASTNRNQFYITDDQLKAINELFGTDYDLDDYRIHEQLDKLIDNAHHICVANDNPQIRDALTD